MVDLVSVVIPTFQDNQEKLEKTIRSVLTQTWEHVEVLVVDDGSEKPFAGLDQRICEQRIKWISLEINGGVAAARNKGLREARGAFIAFLDTGDWWEPGNLQKKIEVFKKSDDSLCLVFSGKVVHPATGKPYTTVPKARTDWIATLLVRNPGIAPSTVLTRKSFLDRIGGFYEQEDIPEDKDLWLRLAKIGRFESLPLPLVHYEKTSASRSRSAERKARTYRRFIEIHDQDIRSRALYEKAWAHYHAAIASKYFYAECVAQGVQHSLLSLRFSWNAVTFLRFCLGLASSIPPLRYERIVSTVARIANRLGFSDSPD